jgi:hypothetical protein
VAPFFLLTVVAVMAACSGSAATNGPAYPLPADQGNGGQAQAVPAASAGSGTQFGSSDSTSSGGLRTDQNGQPLYDINQANLLIIKTGSMDLQVAGIDDALSAATTKIAALGGYTSGSQRSGDGGTATAQATFRIPAQNWDQALVAIRAIGLKVLNEQSQTDDVTGQVVDLGARITNLQATESALQAIMAKADKISDVLAVQAQLTDVRGQIEQAQAEENHLQQQAAYSTLTVNFSLKEVAVETATKQFDPNHEVDQASASLVSILQGLATAGIWFGIVWLPILIAVSILAAIVIFVLRRFGVGRQSDPFEPPTPDVSATGGDAAAA